MRKRKPVGYIARPTAVEFFTDDEAMDLRIWELGTEAAARGEPPLMQYGIARTVTLDGAPLDLSRLVALLPPPKLGDPAVDDVNVLDEEVS